MKNTGHNKVKDETVKADLEKWIQARRDRGVPETGYLIVSLDACAEGCTLHDHNA